MTNWFLFNSVSWKIAGFDLSKLVLLICNGKCPMVVCVFWLCMELMGIRTLIFEFRSTKKNLSDSINISESKTMVVGMW